MPAWLTRALVMAVLHAAGAVIVAELKLAGPTNPAIATWIAFALLIGVSLLWASIDGWLRRPEPVQTWLIAAVVGGLVSGVLNVIGRALFVDQTGASALGVQLTSGAAFTALLIAVPALLGVFVGSRLDPPDRRPADDAADEPAAAKADAKTEAEPEKPRPRATRESSARARDRRARHRAHGRPGS